MVWKKLNSYHAKSNLIAATIHSVCNKESENISNFKQLIITLKNASKSTFSRNGVYTMRCNVFILSKY